MKKSIKVGGYVVKKYQRKASLIKTGGIVVRIDGDCAIVYDCVEYETFLLKELMPLKKSHFTVMGVYLFCRGSRC